MKELKRDTEKEREQDGLEVYRREGKREGGGGERERERERTSSRGSSAVQAWEGNRCGKFDQKLAGALLLVVVGIQMAL